MKLTDLAIRNLSVETGRRVFFDDTIKGFGIRITPHSKTFVLVVHRRNHNEWEKLGTYPVVTLAAAREAARNRLATIQLKQEHIAPVMSFEEAFNLFCLTHTRPKTRKRTADETERLIKKHLMPRLRSRDIGDVATHDLMKLVDKLLPKPGTCWHVFAAARTMFRWASKRRLIPRSPLEDVPAPVEMKARERVLTDAELREVLTRAIADHSTFGRIVQLLIITGQRRGQIGALRGEYIEEDRTAIMWPTQSMKRHAHFIPLTPMATALLTDAPEKGYVFPARASDEPFSGYSKCKQAFDKTLNNVASWHLHDLRRTFSTGIARLGVPPHIKEMLLAHGTAKDPVEAIYDRYTYFEEQRAALLKWETWLQTCLSNAESINGRQLPGLHQDRAQATERRTTRAGRAAA
jgi:integrase